MEINGTASGYAYYGGFVQTIPYLSGGSHTLNVTNCIFDGKFSSTNPSQVVYTGMVQGVSGTLNLSNCLVAPQALIDNPHSWSSTFYVRNGVAGYGGDNNYYTQAINTVNGGKQVYKVTLPKGVTATGDTVVTFGNDTYAADEITLAAKTGYIFSGDKSLTVTGAVTVTGTVTFDTANHYVLADNTSTLATEANTTTYPDLTQVYKVTVPEGVNVTSAKYAVGSDIYVAVNAQVTIAATDNNRPIRKLKM